MHACEEPSPPNIRIIGRSSTCLPGTFWKPAKFIWKDTYIECERAQLLDSTKFNLRAPQLLFVWMQYVFKKLKCRGLLTVLSSLCGGGGGSGFLVLPSHGASGGSMVARRRHLGITTTSIHSVSEVLFRWWLTCCVYGHQSNEDKIHFFVVERH